MTIKLESKQAKFLRTYTRYKKLARQVSEQLLKEGCREVRIDFDNGFSIILRDRHRKARPNTIRGNG